MIVNGERVKQAREIRRLTQTELAEAVNVNQSTIARLEANGIAQPNEALLHAIAFRTGFPIAFFRQESGPEFPLGSLLFRRRLSLASTDKDHIRQTARLSFELVEKFFSQSKQIKPIEVRIARFSSPPELAARATRDALGFSPDTPITRLMLYLEKSGVLVLSLPVSIPKYDAFSLWTGGESRKPVIILSANKPGDRQRFNLAHELGHLVMHHPMTVGNATAEREANKFAAEFLMPEEVIKREMLASMPLTLTDLAELKRRWGVSIQALIMRALSLGLLTRRQVAQRFLRLNALGWREKEPVDIPAEKPRLLRKLAETIYGVSFDSEKVAALVHAPGKFIEEIMAMHASFEDIQVVAANSSARLAPSPASESPNPTRTGTTRIIRFPGKRPVPRPHGWRPPVGRGGQPTATPPRRGAGRVAGVGDGEHPIR